MQAALLRLAVIGCATFALYSDLVIAVPGGKLLPDERIYVSASSHLLAGFDPYEQVDYLYPPPLAVAIAVATDRLGPTGMLYVLRSCFLLSFALMGWAVAESMRRVPAAFRLATGVVLATIAQPTVMAMWAGNWQTVAMAGFFLALLWLDDHPHAAGIALGLSLGLKPAVIVALPLLAFRYRAVTIVACATAAAVVLPTYLVLPDWFEMLGSERMANEVVKETFARNMSFAATVFAWTGVRVPVWALLATGAALGAGLLGLGAPRAVALTLGVTISQPSMWPYSWTLLYPVAGAGIDAAWARFASARARRAT